MKPPREVQIVESVGNVNEILDGHIVLDLECLDRIIDGLDFLSTEDKLKIFNGNVRKVFTRLKVPEAVAA